MASAVEPVDHQMEDTEILEAFKAMGPLLLQDRYIRDPKEEKGPKKPKREHVAETPVPTNEVTKIVRLMGSMLLRLDADQQLMKKQDSFIFFLQTAGPALLPQLMSRAQEWHAQMKQRQSQTDDSPQYVPLRNVLFQDLATLLEDRVHKLSKADPQDALRSTALTHGIITADGSFPFQKWSQQQQTLVQTKKDHITMGRMLKYMEQLKQISMDHSAVQKFHALRQAEGQHTVPWILQTGVRHDEVQVLLEALQGSTVWGLIGATMKPHSQTQSRQAQELQQLLGKGKGKSTTHPSNKGKGKHHPRR